MTLFTNEVEPVITRTFEEATMTWRTMEPEPCPTYRKELPHEPTITKADIDFVGRLEDILRDAGVSPIF